MANIKKKSKVKGMVPAEVVKAVSTGKEPGLALYNSLSINVKTNETAAEREQRKFRRRYICKAFGLKADDLEHFLEEYKNVEKNKPSMSETDILKDKENVSKGQHGAVKAQDRAARDMIFNTLKTIATFAGFSIAPGITVLASIVGLGIGLKRNRKAQVGQVADGTEKDRDYVDYLGKYMNKVDAMNKYMEADMAEIMEKKKTLSKEKFSQYMKEKMAGYKEKMRSDGLEIADEPKKEESEPEQETEEKEKPKKKATTKKGKTTTKKKAAAPIAEGSEREA